MYRLEGAAGAVWLALADHEQIGDLVAHLGVKAHDEFLVAALDLLAEAGLVDVDGDA